MSTKKAQWAIIATVDPALLSKEAATAWEQLYGEPPPWRIKSAPTGEAILLGDEPGLQGMFDQWALAIHQEVKAKVIAVDWNDVLPQAFQADGSTVRTLSDAQARELAQRYGLTETVERPTSREVLVMQSGTTADLLEVLGVTELPQTLRTKEVSGGLAAWSVTDGGGVGVFADELSFSGPCYWLMWGPPPREFSCTIVKNGEDVGCFEIPGPGPKRCPALSDVLGKTTPGEICQALGLDEFVAGNPMA